MIWDGGIIFRASNPAIIDSAMTPAPTIAMRLDDSDCSDSPADP